LLRLDETGPTVFHRYENGIDVFNMDFTPDSSKLIYTLNDSRIAVVELASGQVGYLPPTRGELYAIKLAPDGRRFAIGVGLAGRYAVEVRDLATGQVETTLLHPRKVDRFAWRPDGQTIATACDLDRLIRLWNVPTGKLIGTLEGHKGPNIICSFDSTGRWLLSNDLTHYLRLWETSSSRQLLSFPATVGDFRRVSPANRMAAFKYDDSRKLQLVRLWGDTVYRTIIPGAKKCEAKSPIPVHSGGRLFAVLTVDGIALVDLATGMQVAHLPGRAQPLFWEPDGALLTAGYEGLLRWPMTTNALAGLNASQAGIRGGDEGQIGPPERLLPGGTWGITWGVSADGQTIAIPYRQPNLCTLVVHRGPPVKSVCLQPIEGARFCSVSPDGRWVATGTIHPERLGAKVWDAATGTLSKALPVRGGCDVIFSPDGRWLLTTAGGCRLWKVGSWLEGPGIVGRDACFSPDGRYLAVDAWPGIRLVDTDTGTEVVRLEAPEPMRFFPRAFTPDGGQVITVGEDDAVHVWDLRALRRELAGLGLDWDAPPILASEPASAPPLRVRVEEGTELRRPPAPAEEPSPGAGTLREQPAPGRLTKASTIP
jgi:WD40 repeat protein